MRRGALVTLVMLLAFILAGYLVYTRIVQKPLREIVEVVVCKNPTCHHVFEVRVPIGKGGGPYMCPNCKQESAYLAFQCTDPECGAIFPVTPERMESSSSIHCPVCGHQARMLLRIPEDAETLAIKGTAPP
jgi:DNA-directed RNA polymerase subunit RPC12/RpoP